MSEKDSSRRGTRGNFSPESRPEMTSAQVEQNSRIADALADYLHRKLAKPKRPQPLEVNPTPDDATR